MPRWQDGYLGISTLPAELSNTELEEFFGGIGGHSVTPSEP